MFIMVARTLISFRMVPLGSSGPMMRYVPIEETVILMCSVFVNHMKEYATQTTDWSM